VRVLRGGLEQPGNGHFTATHRKIRSSATSVIPTIEITERQRVCKEVLRR
jgi:hypothetical protein